MESIRAVNRSLNTQKTQASKCCDDLSVLIEAHTRSNTVHEEHNVRTVDQLLDLHRSQLYSDFGASPSTDDHVCALFNWVTLLLLTAVFILLGIVVRIDTP